MALTTGSVVHQPKGSLVCSDQPLFLRQWILLVYHLLHQLGQTLQRIWIWIWIYFGSIHYLTPGPVVLHLAHDGVAALLLLVQLGLTLLALALRGKDSEREGGLRGRCGGERETGRFAIVYPSGPPPSSSSPLSPLPCHGWCSEPSPGQRSTPSGSIPWCHASKPRIPSTSAAPPPERRGGRGASC